MAFQKNIAVIFETEDVYVGRELNLGIETEQWFDVTDYEMLSNDPKNKYSLVPLILFVCELSFFYILIF